ncbi:hypothetical protein KBT16_29660, partial [Nostoc sp. CCCryo 231-06]|nr:hypothetical protein [Nostoc sp. CCCryo 231-06]
SQMLEILVYYTMKCGKWVSDYLASAESFAVSTYLRQITPISAQSHLRVLLKNGLLRCLWGKAFSLSVQFSRFGTVMPDIPVWVLKQRLGVILLSEC